MIRIKINGIETMVSNENHELYRELVNRIINEDVGGETGNDDFDIESTDNLVEFDGHLSIHYNVIEDQPDDLYTNKEITNAFEDSEDAFTKEEIMDAFDIPRNKNQLEMFNSEPE